MIALQTAEKTKSRGCLKCMIHSVIPAMKQVPGISTPHAVQMLNQVQHDKPNLSP